MSTRSVTILLNTKAIGAAAYDKTRKGLAGVQSAVFSLKGALVGLTAGISLQAIAGELSETANQIDGVAKVSDKLGITTEELLGLQHAAGLAGASSEVLDKSLEKMNVNLGRAVSDGGASAEMFEQLGLSTAALAGMTTDEKFRQIADAINALPNASARAAAAQDIFGRSGLQLLNTLELGSEGLRANTEEAKRLGIAYSRVDAAKVEAANDSISRSAAVFTGLKNTLTIEIAPVVDALMVKFTELATSGDGLKSWMPSLQMVASGIGIVADVVDVLYDGFLVLRAGVTKIIANVIRSWADLGYAIEAVVNLLPGVDIQFSDTLTAMADGLDKLANEQWAEAKEAFMAPPPSEGITKFFKDVQAEADKSAQAIARAAEEKQRLESIEQGKDLAVGMFNQAKSGGENLLDIFGGVASGLKDSVADSVVGGLEKAREKTNADLKEYADKAKEANQTPQEIFDKEFAQAKLARDRGFLDPEQFARQEAKLREDLTGPAAPEVQRQGLAAVQSRFLTRAPGASDPALATKKATEESAKTLREVHRAIGKSNDALENLARVFPSLAIGGPG